jgi:hypothetical protein
MCWHCPNPLCFRYPGLGVDEVCISSGFGWHGSPVNRGRALKDVFGSAVQRWVRLIQSLRIVIFVAGMFTVAGIAAASEYIGPS